MVAAVFGLLAASTFTLVQSPCTTTIPGEDIRHCVEFSKAVMHPNDLLNNKQNSLMKFSKTFVIVSVTSFALLSAYSWYRTKKPKLEWFPIVSGSYRGWMRRVG